MAALVAQRLQAHTLARGRFVAPRKGASGTVHDALHYMQFRPLGEQETPQQRALFGPLQDRMSGHVAHQEILEHSSRRVLFHRIILSPGPEQPLDDLQHWTRLAMADLGRHLGQELHWVAVAHRNTNNPHLHVLLAGAGERHGVREPVILRRPDYELLRHAGDYHAERLLGLERSLERLLEHEVTFEAARQAVLPAQEVSASGPGSEEAAVEAEPIGLYSSRGR